MSTPLPELCKKCRKLKMPDLGSFHKVPGRYRDRYFLCHACAAKAPHPRCDVKPSFLERRAIPVLVECGYPFQREFPLDSFRYDFAIPMIGLLIELDSRLWHVRPRQRHRDVAKDKLARERGWKVERIRDPDLEGKLRFAIEQRAEQILPD